MNPPLAIDLFCGLGGWTEGLLAAGGWFGDMNGIAKHGSRSNARKAASAMIAKIPFTLSEYVGRVNFPQNSG